MLVGVGVNLISNRSIHLTVYSLHETHWFLKQCDCQSYMMCPLPPEAP